MKNYNKVSTILPSIYPNVDEVDGPIEMEISDRIGYDIEIETPEPSTDLQLLDECLSVPFMFETEVEPVNAKVNDAVDPYVSVNVQRLNVRKSPNINSGVIKVAKFGDTLLVETFIEEWAKVCTTRGQDTSHDTDRLDALMYGYVMTKFIK